MKKSSFLVVFAFLLAIFFNSCFTCFCGCCKTCAAIVLTITDSNGSLDTVESTIPGVEYCGEELILREAELVTTDITTSDDITVTIVKTFTCVE